MIKVHRPLPTPDQSKDEAAGEQPKHDPVNRPSYYNFSDLQPIDAIEKWGLGFCLGNAVKYIARSGKKENHLQDLKKARWYLDREITNMENSHVDITA